MIMRWSAAFFTVGLAGCASHEHDGAAAFILGDPGREASFHADEVIAVLDAQVEAWNRGDLRGFMAGYAPSIDVTFSGARGTLRGWQAIHDSYASRYPDAAAMGKLAFSELSVAHLGGGAALVVGSWRLERAAGPVDGTFTVVLRRLPAGWRIIHDHTSQREAPPPAAEGAASPASPPR